MQKDIDIIILSQNHTPDADYIPAVSTLDYKLYITEKDKYISSVDSESSCREYDVCFKEVIKLSNKGVILLKN